MSEVTNEEDEERLGRTPRGISTQMATGGKKRASCYCCASQNMGTAATAVCCWWSESVSARMNANNTFKPALPHLWMKHPTENTAIKQENYLSSTIKRFVFRMSEIADVLPINLSWSSRQKIPIMLQKGAQSWTSCLFTMKFKLRGSLAHIIICVIYAFPLWSGLSSGRHWMAGVTN